jgi:cyclophilin family peptidyl-prolyl cis-trans isomerase
MSLSQSALMLRSTRKGWSPWRVGGGHGPSDRSSQLSLQQILLQLLPLPPSHRSFATGSRGSRGHGWFTNYRAGKGGRHLQGEYYDRESVPQCAAWNDAVLQLGCTQIYMDIVMEPRRHVTTNVRSKTYIAVPPLNSLTGTRHRLVIDVAATVMPATCQNFIDLLQMQSSSSSSSSSSSNQDTDRQGYIGTRLYRIERDVGIYGGDVLTNTGKTGRAAHAAALTIDVAESDPLPFWHIPGTVTMLVPTVGEIDSRFMLCTRHAPHLDGICRAFGRMTDTSLEIVTKWQTNLLTLQGIPTAFDLIVVDCGRVVVVQQGASSSSSSQSNQKSKLVPVNPPRVSESVV